MTETKFLEVTEDELECLHDYLLYAQNRLEENREKATREGYYDKEKVRIEILLEKINKMR